MTFLDTDCDSKQSIGALVDILLQHHIDVVFGPPCSTGLHKLLKSLNNIYRVVDFESLARSKHAEDFGKFI